MSNRPKSRLVLWIALGLALTAGAAVIVLVQNLDGLVKRAIESYGSETAGTEVRVADVNIVVREGRGTLRGLTVANPPGYSSTSLFALNDISVALDPLALTAEVVEIGELRIGATAFRYELAPDGQSNLSVLQKHLKKSPETKDSGRQEKSGKRLKIKRLVIADGEATLDLGQSGIGRAIVRVPGVTLTDLGGEQGLTPGELSQKVLNALAKNLEKSVAAAGLQRLLHGREGTKIDQAIRGMLNR